MPGAKVGRVLETVACWEEQPITFTAMLGGSLTDSAELPRRFMWFYFVVSHSLHCLSFSGASGLSWTWRRDRLPLQTAPGALPLPDGGVTAAPTGAAGSGEKWGHFSAW